MKYFLKVNLCIIRDYMCVYITVTFKEILYHGITYLEKYGK